MDRDPGRRVFEWRRIGARRKGVISKELCRFSDLNREGPVAGVGYNGVSAELGGGPGSVKSRISSSQVSAELCRSE